MKELYRTKSIKKEIQEIDLFQMQEMIVDLEEF